MPPVARQPPRSVKKAARQTARANAATARARAATARRATARRTLAKAGVYGALLTGPVAPVTAGIGYGLYEAGEGAYRGARGLANATARFRNSSPLRRATRRIFGRATTGYRANKPGNVITVKPIIKDLHVKLKVLPDYTRPLAEGPQVKVVPYVTFGGLRGNSKEITGDNFDDLAEQVKEGFKSLEHGDKFARHALKMRDVDSDRYKRFKKSMIQKVVEAIKKLSKKVVKETSSDFARRITSEYTGRLFRTYTTVSPGDVEYFITPHYADDDVQPRLQFLFESGYPWNLEVPDNTPEVVLDFIIRADELRRQVALESDYDDGVVLPRATYAAGAPLPGLGPAPPSPLAGPVLGLLPKPPRPGGGAAAAAALRAGVGALPAGSLAGALVGRPGSGGSGRAVPPPGTRGALGRAAPPLSGRAAPGGAATLLAAPGGAALGAAPPAPGGAALGAAPPAPGGAAGGPIASALLAAMRGPPRALRPAAAPGGAVAGAAAPALSLAEQVAARARERQARVAAAAAAGPAAPAPAPAAPAPPAPLSFAASMAQRAAALSGGRPASASSGSSATFNSSVASSPGGIGPVRTPPARPNPGGGARSRRHRRGRKHGKKSSSRRR